MKIEDLMELEKQERQKRLQWSVVIRYLVIFIVVFLSWLSSQFGAAFFLPGILFSVSLALAFNLILSYVYSLKKIAQFWPYLGVVTDMVVITLVVHFTGGITSVFLPLYLLQIVGTNVHFSKLAGPINFFIGTTFFGAIFTLEDQGLITHYTPFPMAPDLHQNYAYIAATGLTLIVLMAVSTYRSGYVVRSLEKVERELAKVNEDLIRANQAFQVANQKLKELDQLKTEFISVASHQLRTPLSAIKWSLKMLLDKDLGPLNNEQTELISKGYQSNERMINLINDLLNVSRIEEGRMSYLFVEQSIEPILRELIEEQQHAAEEKHITIGFNSGSGKLPFVRLDTQKIHLGLQNLLDNAIKYTPFGGKISINISVEREELIVGIQDAGVGIPASQQPRVFSKFFRGDNVMRMQTEGTGLGLFIAHNIIEKHNGRIWFESHEGKGTTFYIALPLVKSRAQNPEKKEEFNQALQNF